jgi:uncharacterized damage-inducible protein DinB
MRVGIFANRTYSYKVNWRRTIFEEIGIMTTGLSEFFHYNLWANLQLIDACVPLSDAQLDATVEGVYGSLRDILLHMFSSEEGYAWRFYLTGDAPSPLLDEMKALPSFDVLKQHAEKSGKELIAITEQSDVSQILHLDDGTYDARLIIVLIQAINHGVDHRSQISTILTQQGITPPDLDAWSYNDSMS